MTRSRWSLVALLVALAMLAAAPGARAAAKPQTRSSLVRGCYALSSATGRPLAAAKQVRMQATTLGRYMLYLPDRNSRASQSAASVSPADAPSPAPDWTVKRVGPGLFSLSPQSARARVLAVAGNG